MARQALFVFLSQHCVQGSTSAPKPLQGVGLQTFSFAEAKDREGLYDSLHGRATEFAEAGFTHVWFPPASSSIDPQGYMPTKWYSLVHKGKFKALNEGMGAAGLTPVCDFVFNHRSGQKVDGCNGQYIVFEDPDWNSSVIAKEDWICNARRCHCTHETCRAYCDEGCHCGNSDTGQNFPPAPDLDHTSPVIQDAIVAYINFMTSEMHCGGVRFDMAGGFDGKFVKLYADAVDRSPFVIGEDYSYNSSKIVDWIYQTGRFAYDVPLRFALRNTVIAGNFEALGEWGKMPGVAGMHPTGASTFVDNHDTTDVGGPVADGGVPAKFQEISYAYILMHPPFPWVYRPQFDNLNLRNKLVQLIAVRTRLGILPGDEVSVVSSTEPGMYAAYIGGHGGCTNCSEKCDVKLAIKLGAASFQPCGIGWEYVIGGTNWTVWTPTSIASSDGSAVETNLVTHPVGGQIATVVAFGFMGASIITACVMRSRKEKSMLADPLIQ